MGVVTFFGGGGRATDHTIWCSKIDVCGAGLLVDCGVRGAFWVCRYVQLSLSSLCVCAGMMCVSSVCDTRWYQEIRIVVMSMPGVVY